MKQRFFLSRFVKGLASGAILPATVAASEKPSGSETGDTSFECTAMVNGKT